MARNSGDGGEVEGQAAADRWRRLGELGIEGGLREAGFSEKSITAILNHVQAAGERIYQNFWDGVIADSLTEIEDGRAVLLAVLGRGQPISSVKELWLTQRSIGDLDKTEATALCVNLSSNPNIEVVALDEQTVFGSQEGCTLLATVLSNNSSLKSLFLSKVNMGSGAVRCLMDGLKGKSSKTLEDLSIGYNPVLDEGIGSVAEMLSSNTSLKRLYMYETQCGSQGAEHMASALEKNITLEILYFGGNPISRDGMKRLLAPLSRGHGADGPKNTTLKELELSNITRDNFSVEAVAWMIRTNIGLSSLSLASTTLLTQDWVDQIFPALRENETLKELDLRSCQGLTIEGCYDALMEIIKSIETGLEEIELTGTGLEPVSDQVDEQFRLNSEHQGGEWGQAGLNSTSGRLYLEFISGKATFRKGTRSEPAVFDDTSSLDTGGPNKLTTICRVLQRFMCWRVCECNETSICCRCRCCCCCPVRD